MNFKKLSVITVGLLISLVLSASTFAQIGGVIPESRITDWENSGYKRNSNDNLPQKTKFTINVAPPTGNPNVDYENINKSIQTAGFMSNFLGLVALQFDSGEYIIDEEILITPILKNLIFMGSSEGKTIIKKGEKSKSSTIIKIEGKRLKEKYQIIDYKQDKNIIILDNPAVNITKGDFIDIQADNGSWHNSQHSKEKDVLGQIVEIESKISDTEFQLKDDISLVWKLASSESKIPFLHKLLMVENIGFNRLTFVPENDNEGNIFEILYAKDTWFSNLETVNGVNAHFQVSYSTQLEFRRNYIHHAQNYGVGGHGYGIEFIRRTTNSLVEDNIFQSLRHAMIVARGANRNVFGYNYSREQKDSVNNVLADLNLHGNFPFLNLFEGNWVDRIHADSYHGSNGFYNTFVRNYSHYKQFKIDDSDQFNIIGNEAKLYLKNSTGNVDNYANGVPHTRWRSKDYKGLFLKDVSYYKSGKPSFMEGYSWPIIGPRVLSDVKVYNRILPARDRFCAQFPKTCR